MTVTVTTLKGLGAGLYYVERLPNYYLDANEPRGRWLGRGAEARSTCRAASATMPSSR